MKSQEEGIYVILSVNYEFIIWLIKSFCKMYFWHTCKSIFIHLVFIFL